MKKFLVLLSVFVLVFALSVPVSASALDDFPNPMTVWTDEYQERFPYAMAYYHSEDEEIVLILSANRPEKDGVKIIASKSDSDLSYLKYTISYDSTYWRYDGGYSAAFSTNAAFYVFASSFDVLNPDGSIYAGADTDFFPAPQIPLWQEMEQVAQGEMTGLSTKTVGTMKVLVLCGVGLIALLVVLKLFGKRSLIYHR